MNEMPRITAVPLSRTVVLIFRLTIVGAIIQVPSSPPTRYAAHVENWSRAQDEKVYPGI